MTKQYLLFPLPSCEAEQSCQDEPRSHRHDPQTSREAARKLMESGKLKGQRKVVFDALHKCDGVTHAELGALMGVHWLTPARRLPELERMGLVAKGQPRLCRVKHSRCTTWWLEPSHECGQKTSDGPPLPAESANGGGRE